MTSDSANGVLPGNGSSDPDGPVDKPEQGGRNDIPVGLAPPKPAIMLYVATVVWLAWIIFLTAMAFQY